uniref:uncharacterized protein LOC122583464 n=1 Tax=Erigeron canadensis TaxID=72917 RepID=UPI001CB95C24|nr:uncharacterized protein LOC122583464 [Erigeron canadensis]
MSSFDEDSVSYIRKYTIDPEMLNTFVAFLGDEDEESGSSTMTNIPRIPRRTVTRNHVEAATRLFNHYFAPELVYPADYFRRRFRMPKEYLFLAYASTADQLDEYLEMGAQTSYESLNHFCKCVTQLYHSEFFRRPTQEDVNRVTAKHKAVHGFPGMLGSIDCMLWAWRNCPTIWQDQYTRGDRGHPTIMLEALLQDNAPAVNCTANGLEFTKNYYLSDGIYSEWATLVKFFKCPMDPKTSKFKRFQESARKDLERAFGVLQG